MTNQNLTTIGAIAARIRQTVSDTWDIDLSKSGDDNNQELTVTATDYYEEERQSHGEIPITGVAVETSHIRNGLYETHLTLLRGGATHSSTRVLISRPKSHFAWIERLIAMIENLPEPVVPMAVTGGELNRWLTVDGQTEIQLWQEDRNIGDYREYYLTVTDRDKRGNLGTELSGLRTEDLYEDVVDAIEGLIDDTTTGARANA